MRALATTEKDKLNWDRSLYKALATLRTRLNRATGYTPAQALLGYNIPPPGQWSIPEYRRRRDGERQTGRARRQKIRQKNQNFNNANFTRDPPKVVFQAGDRVMLRNFAPKHPLYNPWLGPFPVIKKKSDHMYVLKRNNVEITHHVDQLRPAPVDNPIPFVENEQGKPIIYSDTSSDEEGFPTSESQDEGEEILRDEEQAEPEETPEIPS